MFYPAIPIFDQRPCFFQIFFFNLFIFEDAAPIPPALPLPFFIFARTPVCPAFPFRSFVVLALALFSVILHFFFLVLKIHTPFFDVFAIASINLHFLFEAVQYRRDSNDFIHRP